MSDNTNIYKFGEFSLNVPQRELKKAGALIEIEPRAFEVLVYLLAHRDRAVDKAELQDAIWPGVYVTETALTRAVMKARKAVDDDATKQQMIKTLHGHGYRFIAKLEDIPEEIPDSSDENITSPKSPDQSVNHATTVKLSIRSIVLIVIAATAVLALTWVLLRPQVSISGEARIAVLPLTDQTGDAELSWTSFGLMSYVSKIFDNDAAMMVVPVGNVIGLAENYDWNGDLTDPSSLPMLQKLEQVYSTTHVLSMELLSEGKALRMNYSLLTPGGDVQRGTIVGDEGTQLAQGVVQAVYGAMFHRSHLTSDIPLISKDAFNNEAYARGMDLSVQGRCAEAVEFFRIIIAQEPSLYAPRYELAYCLRILGETEEAETILNTLIEELSPLGPSTQLAEAMQVLGILYNRTGRLDQSEAIYKKALFIADELDAHILKARILQNLGIVSRSKTDLENAERYLDLAILAYQDAGLEELPGHLYSGRANLFMAHGKLVEAEVELEKALQAFRSVGDRRNEAMMLSNTGYLRYRQGRFDEAEAYHLRALEIRQDIGDRVGLGRSFNMLSVVYSAQGHYDEAIVAARSAREVAKETNDRLFEATSLAQLADAEKSNGDIESARRHYVESRQIFVEIQDHLRELQVDLKVARIDLSMGKVQAAEQVAMTVLGASRENAIMTTEVQSLELLGDLARERNNTTDAISQYQQALTILSSSSWSSKINTLKTKLANAYMDQSDLTATAPLVGALAALPDNVQSLKAQARYADMNDDTEKAVALMNKAKILAGDKWADSSETSLQTYMQKSNSDDS